MGPIKEFVDKQMGGSDEKIKEQEAFSKLPEKDRKEKIENAHERELLEYRHMRSRIEAYQGAIKFHEMAGIQGTRPEKLKTELQNFIEKSSSELDKRVNHYLWEIAGFFEPLTKGEGTSPVALSGPKRNQEEKDKNRDLLFQDEKFQPYDFEALAIRLNTPIFTQKNYDKRNNGDSETVRAIDLGVVGEYTVAITETGVLSAQSTAHLNYERKQIALENK